MGKFSKTEVNNGNPKQIDQLFCSFTVQVTIRYNLEKKYYSSFLKYSC